MKCIENKIILPNTRLLSILCANNNIAVAYYRKKKSKVYKWNHSHVSVSCNKRYKRLNHQFSQPYLYLFVLVPHLLSGWDSPHSLFPLVMDWIFDAERSASSISPLLWGLGRTSGTTTVPLFPLENRSIWAFNISLLFHNRLQKIYIFYIQITCLY